MGEVLNQRLLAVLGEAQAIGAIGAAPVSEHISHAEAFLEVFGDRLVPGAHLLDLGSGGGLPGLVIAAARPDLRIALLDGRRVRAEWLQVAIEQLGIEARVSVVAARAEEAGRQSELRTTFDAVVSRGFGPPAVTAECAAPFLQVGGFLLVSGPPGGDAGRWPTEGCAILGLAVESLTSEPRSFALLRQVTGCPERFPRRVGIPGKRPLF